MQIGLVVAFMVFASFSTQKAQAQSVNNMMEISWYAYGVTYSGLMVTFTDNTGGFVVDFYHNGVGYVRVVQDVNVRYQYDAWGNCTTYLYGYNAVSSPSVYYSPDSFVIYPNGMMYTQDASGVWSTMITARMVPSYQWSSTLRKYGLGD